MRVYYFEPRVNNVVHILSRKKPPNPKAKHVSIEEVKCYIAHWFLKKEPDEQTTLVLSSIVQHAKTALEHVGGRRIEKPHVECMKQLLCARDSLNALPGLRDSTIDLTAHLMLEKYSYVLVDLVAKL
jgi:hypothetical protein